MLPLLEHFPSCLFIELRNLSSFWGSIFYPGLDGGRVAAKIISGPGAKCLSLPCIFRHYSVKCGRPLPAARLLYSGIYYAFWPSLFWSHGNCVHVHCFLCIWQIHWPCFQQECIIITRCGLFRAISNDSWSDWSSPRVLFLLVWCSLLA